MCFGLFQEEEEEELKAGYKRLKAYIINPEKLRKEIRYTFSRPTVILQN